MNVIDFGYPWWLSYGHLVLALVLVGLLFLVRGRISRVLLAVLVIWSLVSFVVLRFVIDINGRASMPTQTFIESGRVLDLGAGTGRSSVMVLEARPKVTLVALDLFGESFAGHFGKTESGEQKLLANLKAAGVEGRASVVKHDMRELPFEAGVFEGVVSAYALDHLGRVGINKTLREAARVLKPGGMLVTFCPDEQVYRKHCAATDQPYNPMHKHTDFSLAYVKAILERIGGTETVHEIPLIDDYSWDLVVRKTS